MCATTLVAMLSLRFLWERDLAVDTKISIRTRSGPNMSGVVHRPCAKNKSALESDHIEYVFIRFISRAKHFHACSRFQCHAHLRVRVHLQALSSEILASDPFGAMFSEALAQAVCLEKLAQEQTLGVEQTAPGTLLAPECLQNVGGRPRDVPSCFARDATPHEEGPAPSELVGVG